MQVGKNPEIYKSITLCMSNFKNLKKIFFSTVCCAVLFCAAGCVESQEITLPEDNVIVTLRVDEVFKEKAFIRLNHDGLQDDYWFHVMTEDLDTDPETLLRESIAEAMDANEGKLSVRQGTNTNLTFEGLDPKTEYRVIASRVLADGTMTGNVAELVFKTLRDLDVFEIHPDWKIEYKERRVSKDDVNEETEVFSCVVGDSEDTYVPCLLSKADFAKSYGGNLRACFEDYVAFRNMEHVKWPSVVRNEDIEHIEDRLRSGDYVVFMVGVDAEGVLTGYYAMEEFTIRQETATDAYRKWVGKWTLSGICGDKTIKYPIEIKADENNLYYRMYGWESTSVSGYLTDVPTQLPILLYFEKSSGSVYVVSEELPDLPSLAGIYYFYLYGCIEIEYDGVMTPVPVDVPNLRLARFTLNDSGTKAYATPERFVFDMNGVHYDSEFIYFSYSFIFPALYQGLVPVTTDSVVPRIASIVLEK